MELEKQIINKQMERTGFSFDRATPQNQDYKKLEKAKMRRELHEKIMEDRINQCQQKIEDDQIRHYINYELIMSDKKAKVQQKNLQTMSVQEKSKSLKQLKHEEILTTFFEKNDKKTKKNDEEKEKKQDETKKKLKEIIERRKKNKMQHELIFQKKIKRFEQNIKKKDQQSELGDTFNPSELLLHDKKFNNHNHYSTMSLFRERDQINRHLVEENLQREKRKLEWKKLNILAKESIQNERIQTAKENRRIMMQTQSKLKMKWNQQKDHIKSAITFIKQSPFSPGSKKIIQKALPSLEPKEIDEIYRDSSEERRKKKAEEEQKNQF